MIASKAQEILDHYTQVQSSTLTVNVATTNMVIIYLANIHVTNCIDSDTNQDHNYLNYLRNTSVCSSVEEFMTYLAVLSLIYGEQGE